MQSRSLAFGRSRGPDVQTTSDDGHMALQCGRRDNMLFTLIGTSGNRWPKRLPEVLSCVVGRHELRVEVVPVPPRYADVAELRAGPDRTVEVRHANAGTIAQDFSLSRERAWVPVKGVQAVTSKGREWAGVTCAMRHGEHGPLLRVAFDASDRSVFPDAEGACILPVEGGSTVRLPVRTRNIR